MPSTGFEVGGMRRELEHAHKPPPSETIRDTLAWDIARGGPTPGEEGLTAAQEQRLLSV